MVSATRAVRALLVPLALVVLLAIPSPALAMGCVTEPGDLLIPTGVNDPPPIISPLMEDIFLVHFLGAVTAGDAYSLEANGAVLTVCVGTCLFLPDFNVAWYDSSEALIADHSFPGDQTGTVPPGATTGVVYMSLGPDAGTTDGSAFARFLYTQGTCV